MAVCDCSSLGLGPSRREQDCVICNITVEDGDREDLFITFLINIPKTSEIY